MDIRWDGSNITSRRVASRKPRPWVFRVGGVLHFRPIRAWGTPASLSHGAIIVESRGHTFTRT